MATTIIPSQLPALNSPRIQQLGWSESCGQYIAYRNVLEAEELASLLLNTAEAHANQWPKEKLTAAKDKLSLARVAGYLLLEFAAQSDILGFLPSAALVTWFTSRPQNLQSSQHDVIIDTGKLLRDKFIRMFRTSNVPYTSPFSHPSRPSFDTLEDMTKDSMEATRKDYRTSRHKVLARDGYRCVVTGLLNESSVRRCPELGDRHELALVIETAHIFNESTAQGIDPAVSEDTQDYKLLNKTHYAAGALAILETFGFSKFVDAFKQAGGVHEAWNLLSLQRDLHFFFDNLQLWFEHTDKPNRYKVCTLGERREGYIRRVSEGDNRYIDGAPMFVEFNAGYEGVPPPDPLLLALHAMCARVAHMSGAAEFFDQLERDVEETNVLAFDGSSAPLLSNLLSPFAVIPGVA